ncbi:DNA repair protein RadC [Neomegalonema sp.]|uniref:RadC family protein n=1 Tax=Neomegalonema sp. TaxID=2039713 RepID=UPI002609FCFC|nr:DNA repair protein RadC [Neomegalonema sp.]MDD2868824.1 DNA repair protein RadC [Neomegalonema sp.]
MTGRGGRRKGPPQGGAEGTEEPSDPSSPGFEDAAPSRVGGVAPASAASREEEEEGEDEDPEAGEEAGESGRGSPQRSTKSSEIPLHAGHRDRLRARFLKGGLDAVHDYELLELLLFRAIPRRDVKPLAKALLGRFHDVEGVLSAEPARLREVKGLGDSAIVEFKIVEAAAHRLAQAKVIGRPVFAQWSEIVAYCRTRMAHLPVEEVRLLFLDKKNALMADEARNRGTVDHAPVYPREVAKRAVELRASGVVMAHNHPTGDPSPSAADVRTTKDVKKALEAVGVQLIDHIIVGKKADVSLRARDLL